MKIFDSERDYDAFDRILDAPARRSANRGQPYGSDAWVQRMTKRFRLESTFRRPGRPREQSPKNRS